MNLRRTVISSSRSQQLPPLQCPVRHELGLRQPPSALLSRFRGASLKLPRKRPLLTRLISSLSYVSRVRVRGPQAGPRPCSREARRSRGSREAKPSPQVGGGTGSLLRRFCEDHAPDARETSIYGLILSQGGKKRKFEKPRQPLLKPEPPRTRAGCQCRRHRERSSQRSIFKETSAFCSRDSDLESLRSICTISTRSDFFI